LSSILNTCIKYLLQHWIHYRCVIAWLIVGVRRQVKRLLWTLDNLSSKFQLSVSFTLQLSTNCTHKWTTIMDFWPGTYCWPPPAPDA